jgi:hypothetical protein
VPGIRRSILVVAASAGAAAGCVRDPAEHVCPALAEGSLVVTELRGAQAMAEPDQSQWIELYNASGGPVELEGLVVRVRKVDGSGEDRIIVRGPVSVAADDYVVIGIGFEQPPHVDYAAGGDTGTDLLENAAIQVEVCDDQADDARYVGLPSPGTYSLGTTPPSAVDNDLAANWCNLDTPAEGTPGAANPPCP